MGHLGINPWDDELAHRVEHAKRLLLAMRGEMFLEDDHFPDWRRRQ